MPHPESEPSRPLNQGAARRINVTLGMGLPTLVHHSFHDYGGPFGGFRPVTNCPFDYKPRGGLLAYPAVSRPGVYRPWPQRSEWTQWCENEGTDSWINHHTQARLHPHRNAVFAVIDSAADARALADAFPAEEDPTFAAMKKELNGRSLEEWLSLEYRINWTRLHEAGLSGIYLTAQGERATRYPERGTPCLMLWDMPTVWFCQPHYRVGKPWRSRFIGPWPHLTPSQVRRARKREAIAKRGGDET